MMNEMELEKSIKEIKELESSIMALLEVPLQHTSKVSKDPYEYVEITTEAVRVVISGFRKSIWYFLDLYKVNYVVVDGIEGSGKTSLLQGTPLTEKYITPLLENKFTDNNDKPIQYHLDKFPNRNTKFGELFYKYLDMVNIVKNKDLIYLVMCLCNVMDRLSYTLNRRGKEDIPLLASIIDNHMCVLCDRFYMSNILTLPIDDKWLKDIMYEMYNLERDLYGDHVKVLLRKPLFDIVTGKTVSESQYLDRMKHTIICRKGENTFFDEKVEWQLSNFQNVYDHIKDDISEENEAFYIYTPKTLYR